MTEYTAEQLAEIRAGNAKFGLTLILIGLALAAVFCVILEAL